MFVLNITSHFVFNWFNGFVFWFLFQFVLNGIFKAELNEFLTRQLAEDGYSGVEIRVTPTRTEIIIMATKTLNVLGEKGRRIRELTAVVQKRYEQMKSINAKVFLTNRQTKFSPFADSVLLQVPLNYTPKR